MGFPGGHAGGFFHQGRVKGPGLRNGDGVHRAVAVNHVQPEKQRDAQPALLHGNLLQLIGLGRVLHHQGADSPGADLILVIVLLGGTHNFFELGIGKPPVGDHLDELAKGDLKSPHNGGGFLVHLADLFLQGHLSQQAFDFVPLGGCQCEHIELFSAYVYCLILPSVFSYFKIQIDVSTSFLFCKNRAPGTDRPVFTWKR